MIRNYVKQYEAWQDLDPDDIELKPGTRKPSEKVLDQLFDDINNNNLQGVKDYIACDYDPNAKNSFEETPLIFACDKLYMKSISLAKYLVEHGADVNAKDKSGDTPLICACRCFHPELAEYLVENGADVNAKNNYGNTPLILACERNKIELAKYLVENGADVNAKNKDGKTVIDIAIKNDYIPLLGFLWKNK